MVNLFLSCQALNVVMWQVAVAIGLAVVYGLAPTRAETTLYVGGYTILETVFYNCFYKVAWSLALAWVIFSCSNGYGGDKSTKFYRG